MRPCGPRSTRTIALVEAAQGGDDGYLNSYYQVAGPGLRWTDFAQGHELYCAGHPFQAAVARRFADYIDATFGPGRRPATPGHPEIERALVELYRETRERRSLDRAGFFADRPYDFERTRTRLPSGPARRPS